MKKNQFIKKLFLGATMILSLNACTKDFEEINANPNYPEKAASELLLPGILRQMSYNWGNMGWEQGFTVAQYGARLQFTSGDRYNWSPTGNPYNDAYDALRDVENIIESTVGVKGQENYLAVALIVKSWFYSYLTDAYGDVPYTQATKGIREDNITPEFTPQSEIYDGLITDLTVANNLLKGAATISGDILYNGDVTKWRKFSNSLRLRLLMRISDVDKARAISEMKEITNAPSEFPIFESNGDAAVIQWNSDNPQPKFTTRSGSYDEVRLSTTLETRLKDLNDQRLIVFAQPTSASGKGIYSDNMDDYVGMPNGLNDEDALAYSPSGDPQKSGSNFISRLGVLLTCRACDPENASPTASQTIIMSYSELQFILAEAREKNFITAGTSEQYYENGIYASFEYYLERINAGGWNEIATSLASFDVDAYINQEKVAYTGTSEEKLGKVAMQKWISLFYTGFEAWSDWRRTNMPAIVPGPDAANGGKVPVRFQYPNSVKSTNNANYQEAVSRMGGDNLNTLLWWDVSVNN